MYLKKLSLALILAGMAAGQAQAALNPGDIAFTSFNADEDGLSFVPFVDIAANTSIYFSDNEWNGSAIGAGGAFNTGESYNQWNSGVSNIGAGSVIRLIAYDKTTLSASVGTLSRVTVASNTNWGLANSNETVYAYLGSSATAPTTFLAAITNSDFGATDGTLTNTGLSQGASAIRLNANNTVTTPDFGEYFGSRSGQVSFAGYKPLVANASNWTVDTTNGAYAATVPNTTAFTVTPVPEADTWAMLLAGLGVMGLMVRRKTA